MNELVECVPNISEGRRSEVIKEIADALAAVPGALLLDQSSDYDHNRTVFTLAGSRQGVKSAVVKLFETVIDRVDMRLQSGAHPRIGAVDVVPFIPVRGVTIADCVNLAKETAEAVAVAFNVPTFLYAEAAARPERKILAAIRKGEFEGLTSKLSEPEWKPDFGPGVPHPTAGAAAFGARPFLIAYNILLDTSDIKVARAIARIIRASSGGLDHVQAIGLYLAKRNLVQVSINLLDFEKTPVHEVQQLVESEAAKRGARIVESEIVGLIPQDALLTAAAHYLQIGGWKPSLVLENALQIASAEHSA